MAVKPIVTMKGRKDGISIILDANADFEDIKASLRKKVSQGKNFFDDAGVKVTFKGRNLDEYGEKVLADIIAEASDAPVQAVQTGQASQSVQSNEKTEIAYAPQSFAGLSLASAIFAPPPVSQNRREIPTAFYRTGLRSGQRIKYEGSVVIIGDANPGSEIIADGNVVVLGALKGMAHAGASGDSTCFVAALALSPTQLRIAGIISFVPSGARKAKAAPAYAYVKDGQVFIGPL
ncbi:MAG: septum site-determining protein MinC [Defluviitaleaceae bacterium]|nr:septum site-determining protein MinC [Defluviitaleaceae bacterium]